MNIIVILPRTYSKLADCERRFMAVVNIPVKANITARKIYPVMLFGLRTRDTQPVRYRPLRDMLCGASRLLPARRSADCNMHVHVVADRKSDNRRRHEFRRRACTLSHERTFLPYPLLRHRLAYRLYTCRRGVGTRSAHTHARLAHRSYRRMCRDSSDMHSIPRKERSVCGTFPQDHLISCGIRPF